MSQQPKEPAAAPAAAAAAAAGLNNSSDDSTSTNINELQDKMANLQLLETRRRLSLAATGENTSLIDIDGSARFADDENAKGVINEPLTEEEKAAAAVAAIAANAAAAASTPNQQSSSSSVISVDKAARIIWQFRSISHVGYVPFNNNKVNQDRACESFPFGANQFSRAFFGVFDGHGQWGHYVSQFCATNLPRLLAKQSTLATSPERALYTAFDDCHRKLAYSKIDVNYSGTTAVCVYIEGNNIYCANVGDSRCVLAQLDPETNRLVAVDLSHDQKPGNPEERQRIYQAGGRVDPCHGPHGEPIGPLRVWLASQDIPGLAMSRSFGDRVAASVGVTHHPEVTVHTFDPSKDEFLLLASDGVWEFISSQEAVEIAAQYDNPQESVTALFKQSQSRWRRDEEVIDDITVLMVQLTNNRIIAAEASSAGATGAVVGNNAH